MSLRPTVFISYARENYGTALEIFEYLESIGVEPWMDKKRLIGGQDWDRAITRAVRKCDFFLFCASPRSVTKRGAVQREIKLALDVWREKLEEDIYFIPVRLEACDLPESIKRFQWIDYFEEDAKPQIQKSIVMGTQQYPSQVVLPLQLTNKVLTDNREGKWNITFQYPEFLPAEAVGIPAINLALSTFANRSKLKFLSQVANFDFEHETMPFFLSVGYTVTLVSSDLISIRFDEGIYTGGAHPNSYTRTFNFTREPWCEFDVEYLPAEKKYLEFFEVLSTFCVKDIMRQRLERNPKWVAAKIPGPHSDEAVEDTWLRSGVSPDPRNFMSFCCEPNNFLFIFDPYQVGSYAEGRSEVRIPFEALAPYVRPDLMSKLGR